MLSLCSDVYMTRVFALFLIVLVQTGMCGYQKTLIFEKTIRQDGPKHPLLPVSQSSPTSSGLATSVRQEYAYGVLLLLTGKLKGQVLPSSSLRRTVPVVRLVLDAGLAKISDPLRVRSIDP